MLHCCSHALCARPVQRPFFPDAGHRTFSLQRRSRNRPARAPVRVQSSRVATQLAGPRRSLGPPRIAGSMCRASGGPGPRGLHPQRADFQNDTWAFAFSRSPHQPFAAHSKVSELFEISRVQGPGSIAQLRRCRIDFRVSLASQRVTRNFCWIEQRLRHCGAADPVVGRTCGARILARCAFGQDAL